VSRRHAPAANPAEGLERASRIAIVIACVGLALWTHRRVLGGFFTLDDLLILEEMRGIRPHAFTLWRALSGEVYFRAAAALFGSHPFPYHLVSWLLHGVNVVLLFALVRRAGGRLATAALAAGLFGTTRLAMTAVHSPASIGELGALGFTIGAFLVGGDDRIATLRRGGLFTAALLCKESVMLLPLLLLLPLPGAGPLAIRVRRAAPLLALSAVVAAGLVFSGAGGTRLGGEAYALGWGENLLRNLLTYAAWTVDMRAPIPDQLMIGGPHDLAPARIALVVMLSLALTAWHVTRLPAFGALAWLLGIAPVLPFLNHTYLHYLYASCAGAAIALAGVLEWGSRVLLDRDGATVVRRSPRPLVAGSIAIAAAVLVLAHAAVSERLLGKRETLCLADSKMPLDPYLRKSEVARRASDAVGIDLEGQRGRVAFLLPVSIQRFYSVATGGATDAPPPGVRRYGLVEGSLDDGRALRALHSNVDTVAFLDSWQPGFKDYELFGQDSDGEVFLLGHGADGFAIAAALLMDGGGLGPATEMLAGALTESPDNAALRYQNARAHYLAGDSLGMQHELEELVRRAPNHPLALRLRSGGMVRVVWR